ncbi:MAG: haloacid dehalogenase type II [Lachnospiraceae bacterium]|nr:haloacid dehalogenase type II [Lachnospiraceae bacterium]
MDKKRLVPKAITFDVYGTLIDWEGEVQDFMRKIFKRDGITNITPYEAQQRWEILQFDYIKTYRPYFQVLFDTLQITADDMGFKVTEQDKEDFSRSMRTWRAFPDTVEAMKLIRKHTKAYMLTNTDNDIIRDTLSNAGIEVDGIFTAEQAGAYKPSHKGFLMSQKELGLTADEMMHAGFGFRYDIIPGNELGYRTIWVNRQGIVRPIQDGDVLENCKEDVMTGDLMTLGYVLEGYYQADLENGFKD